MYPLIGEPLYQELWRGCVGAWSPCLGPTGLTLRDWSGYGNHGTLTNVSAGTIWAANQGRYAVALDGSDDYGLVADNNALDIPANGNLTIAGWIYRTANVAAYETLVTKRLSAGTTVNYELSLNNTSTGGSKSFIFYSGSSFTVSTTLVPLSVWTHIGSVSTAAETTYYLNGTSAGTSATTVASPNAHPFKIGGVAGSPETQFLSANVDDIRIYSRALSASEMRLLASRRGIAHELAPRRRSRIFTGGFKAYWAARKSQIIGGGL
jgi:hypothetical protein